jgi:CheY-like chemotaxis protein
MLVLFIDDDPDDFELFCEAIKAMTQKSRCLHARDGNEALKILEEISILPDLIFLDINMPGMNGMECLNEIKSRPNLKDIPVYMYSTTISQNQSVEFMKLGAKDCIVKPSSYTDLFTTLEKLSLPFSRVNSRT